MQRPERDPRAFEYPPAFAGYAFSILYIILGGLGLSVDFGEGKYPLLLGVASLPFWDLLSRATAYRNAMGAIRWTLNFGISPVVILYLIRDFLGGFH